MASTTIKGAQAVAGLSGLICGMVCRMAMMRKYTLASLLNCRIRASMRYGDRYWGRSSQQYTWMFGHSLIKIGLNFMGSCPRR